ncbi:MAG: T9SS type A sorting domain-containing protein, partial [Flavobacteriales bacterium]
MNARKIFGLVFVPEDTNCTEITLWIDALGDLPADLLLEYQIEGLLEEIEGDMMLFNSCGETGIVLCVPDGCYNFSLALEEWSQIPIWVGVYIDGSLHEDFVIEPETGGVLGAFGVNTDCETSIEERELDLNVYPNPVSDLINIDLSRWENATVQVLGSNGQLILNQKIKSNKTQLDASSWASGVY